MIIQIMSNLFEEGYLERERYSLLSAFFSNGNVAFRRKALEGVDPYDRQCNSGEDQDMCFRLARAGWELYFARNAVVRHKCRTTVRTFIRQWFNYGFHHPYLFAKHNFKGFTLYRMGKGADNGALYKELLHVSSPLPVLIFITPFFALHVLLALTVIFAATGLNVHAVVSGALTVAVAISYFRSDMWRKNIPRGIAFVFFRYIVNLALFMGGLLGGARRGMLYIGPTFDYHR